MNADSTASRIIALAPDEQVSRRRTLAVAIALTLAGTVALLLAASTATSPTAVPRQHPGLSLAKR